MMRLPLVLFIFSAFLSASANPAMRWNKGRGYAPFANATQEGIIIDNTSSATIADIISLPVPASSFSLSFRASNHHASPTRRFPHIDTNGHRKSVAFPSWAILLIFDDKDSVRINVKAAEAFDAISSESATRLTVSPPHDESRVVTVPAGAGLDPYTGVNLWHIAGSGSMLEISGGNRGLNEILTIPLPYNNITGFGFEAAPAANLLVSDITFSDTSPPSISLYPDWKGVEHFNDIIRKSKDPLEGYWAIFDMTLEENMLRRGGDYRLAMRRDGERYVIIYVSGAAVNKDRWKEGMVKAILSPRAFSGVYDVEWIDTEGNSLSDSVIAQIEDGNIITIQFPRHDSTLRLRKCDR